MPSRWTGTAGGMEVGLLVAYGTMHGCQAMTVGTALDRRLVQPTVFALARTVAGWMAVHTTRTLQHFCKLGEHRRRSLRRIGDRGEALGRCEALWLVGSGVRSRRADQEGHQPNEDLHQHPPIHHQCPLIISPSS